MEAQPLLLILSALLFLGDGASAVEVFSYLSHNFTGKTKLYSISECTNFKPHQIPSSIRVDGCISFYSQRDCLGYRFEIDNDEAVLYLNKPKSMGPCSKAVSVLLCEDADYMGSCKNIDVTECCLDLKPINFDKNLTSLNTRGSCVKLYDQAGCSGKSIDVQPGSKSHNNLMEIGFNDLTSSLRLCPPANITYPCEQGSEGPWYCTEEDEPHCFGGNSHFKRLERGHGCPCGEACCVTALLPGLFRN